MPGHRWPDNQPPYAGLELYVAPVAVCRGRR